MDLLGYAIFSSIKQGTPLLLGTTGEIMTQKSGSLNLGVEGMMAMGAIFGYYFTCVTGSLIIGILCSFLFAGIGASIFAFLTITLQANQNVTGLSLTIFGIGVYKFFGALLVNNSAFPKMPEHIKSLLKEDNSNIFAQNKLVYLAIAIALICWIYLKFTKSGLKLNAVGENPSAADAAGINIKLYKYLNVICGGGIVGIGGLYMALIVNNGAWNDNWINGFGWISVALVIFSNWSPLVAIFGSYLFGFIGALETLSGNFARLNPSLLGWMAYVPKELYKALPFIITAIVLIASSIRKNSKSNCPSAIGLNYYREER